jgi:pimeloyl-ACP methyl ester carboxylesterase
MRLIFLFLLQLFLIAGAAGQKTDSIKYSNGYLYFHEYGAGEPVILLSGGPGANYQQLEDVAITLGKRYRIIALEQRGTGLSIPKPFDTSTINLNTAHADINRLLNHLKLQQASFIGHSWGAMLAMSFASNYSPRVKSLILIDPGPFKLDEATFEVYAANREARLTPSDKEMLDSSLKKMQSSAATKKDSAEYYKWELIPVLFDRTKADSLIIKINKGGLNPKMGALIFQSLNEHKFDLSKPLSRFTKPVHVICGNQDPLNFVSYELKIILPKARLHWINKSGHFPMYEQPEQFYSTLFSILDTR